jgi:hypothetical protein
VKKRPACGKLSVNDAGDRLGADDAPVLSDLANFWAVGDSEAIHFDVVEVARAFCSESRLRCRFSGTDPIGPVSELRFDQTTFDGDVYFILKTRPTQTKLLAHTRFRTEWSFRVRPDH